MRWTGRGYIAYNGSGSRFHPGVRGQVREQGIRVNAIMTGLMNTPLIQPVSGRHADMETDASRLVA